MERTTTIPTSEAMKPMNQDKQVWIGLVGADQREGVSFLGDAKGGYVNVVASAANAGEFERKVKRALDELGLELIDIDDAEPLAQRLSRETATEEVSNMAKTVRKLDSVAFGTFYRYEND